MASVQLHDFPPDQLDAIVSWRNDNEVNQFLRPGMRTQEQVQTWYDETFSTASNRLFAIYHDHDLIGYASIEDIDVINQSCEFGIVIGNQQYWRQGIGKTVIKNMLEMAFTQLAMHRVMARIHDGNTASINCFTRSGFQFEGRHREAKYVNGKYVDLLFYAILESEWRRLSSREPHMMEC